MQRQLQDYQTINAILSRITLPVSNQTKGNSLVDVELTQISCANIQIQDLKVDHAELSESTQRLSIQSSYFDLDCTFRWSYEVGFLEGGSGIGFADFRQSQIQIDFDFSSPDFEEFPPNDFTISFCQDDGFKVSNLEFDGDGLGLSGYLLNSIDFLLRSTVEEEVGIAACETIEEKLGGYLFIFIHSCIFWLTLSCIFVSVLRHCDVKLSLQSF